MSVVAPPFTSFNGGETTPLLRGRTDQNIWSIAVRKMLGYVPLLQGPAEACPGTLFVAVGKSAHRLIPFEYNETQGYVIEAGNLYFRFYTNDVRIETAPDVAYELVSPYSIAQLQSVDWDQSLDVLYLTQGEVEPHILFRTSADTFDIEALGLRNGPWETRNSDESLTVSFSGTTGSVTATASGDLFEAGDVGGLMEIEFSDFSAVKSWEPGMTVTAAQLIQWGGRVYEHVGGNLRTGSIAPVHIEGDQWDGQNGQDVNTKGPYGVIWRYLYDRFGQIRFTAYTSATEMVADVERRLAATSASWRWRFGAFSDRRGWPAHCAIWQDRLALLKDFTAHCSVVGDHRDFGSRNEFGDISRDMAFSVVLPYASPVKWMLADRDLVIGTGKGEFVISAASAGAGVGPGNVDVSMPSAHGSASSKPVKVGPRAVYLQRARAKLMQLGYDQGRLLAQESENLSRFSDHIGAKGLNEPVLQKEPHRLIWLRCDDGSAAGVAFDPDEQLLGWFRRDFAAGLTLKSHTSITDPDGRFAQMWFSVQVGDEHWVLRLAPFRASDDDGLDKIMSDAAVVLTGAASASISVPHLAGKTVEIVADGKPHLAVTLDESGDGALEYEAETKIVGLPFPAEMVLQSVEAGSDNGVAQNKITRVHRLDVRVLHSDGVEVEVHGIATKHELLTTGSTFDTAYPLVSGDIIIEADGDWDRDELIKIRRYLPKPSTILAVYPYMQKASS
jgi:hypothetical protein